MFFFNITIPVPVNVSQAIQGLPLIQFLCGAVETLHWTTVATKRNYQEHEVREVPLAEDDLRHFFVDAS